MGVVHDPVVRLLLVLDTATGSFGRRMSLGSTTFLCEHSAKWLLEGLLGKLTCHTCQKKG